MQIHPHILITFLLLATICGCKSGRPPAQCLQPKGIAVDYHYGGYSERWGDGFRNIDAVGDSVIQSYPQREGKGLMVSGQRITLLPDRLTVRVGDTLRIFHVFEDQRSAAERYVMGPKPIFGLWVDGVCADSADAKEPYPDVMIYDGRVLSGPGWDYNYEFSKVVFATPGRHIVQWKRYGLVSNLVEILTINNE